MKHFTLVILLAVVLSGPAAAEPAALLKLPNFDSLTEHASESVIITLDSALLGMAARFLDSDNPEDAAVKDIVNGLQGIYVRSFTVDEDFVYPRADLDGVRKQLSGPGGSASSRYAAARSRRTSTSICRCSKAKRTGSRSSRASRASLRS